MIDIILLASLSSPFIIPQPPQRHLPTSSSLLAPGGAWPFTSLHWLHIKAKRFFGKVSSSPRRASASRSYHRGPPPSCEYCGADGNAFGANSALVSGGESGRCQGGAVAAAVCGTICDKGLFTSGVERWGVLGNDAGIVLPGMFAVGGGTILVLPPSGVVTLLCFAVPFALPFGLGVPPYFFNSSCVELYFVAALSFSIVVLLCFSNSSSWD